MTEFLFTDFYIRIKSLLKSYILHMSGNNDKGKSVQTILCVAYFHYKLNRFFSQVNDVFCSMVKYEVHFNLPLFVFSSWKRTFSTTFHTKSHSKCSCPESPTHSTHKPPISGPRTGYTATQRWASTYRTNPTGPSTYCTVPHGAPASYTTPSRAPT